MLWPSSLIVHHLSRLYRDHDHDLHPFRSIITPSIQKMAEQLLEQVRDLAEGQIVR